MCRLLQAWMFIRQKIYIYSDNNENMLFWRKTEKIIWKPRFSKRTPFQLTALFLSIFLWHPLSFVQILKIRNTPNFWREETIKEQHYDTTLKNGLDKGDIGQGRVLYLSGYYIIYLSSEDGRQIILAVKKRINNIK